MIFGQSFITNTISALFDQVPSVNKSIELSRLFDVTPVSRGQFLHTPHTSRTRLVGTKYSIGVQNILLSVYVILYEATRIVEKIDQKKESITRGKE